MGFTLDQLKKALHNIRDTCVDCGVPLFGDELRSQCDWCAEKIQREYKKQLDDFLDKEDAQVYFDDLKRLNGN